MSLTAPMIAGAASVSVPDIFISPGPTGFVRLAYQRDPWSVLWAVRADGELCGMTYQREQDVWAWHRHPRTGKVRDIAVIPNTEGTADEVWLSIEREVDGQTKRYIEVMALPHEPANETDTADFLYLDSALSYTGDPVTVLGGLDHLEGEEVAILADGAVHAPLTVSSGQITLAQAASTVHVGLNYASLVETLRLEQTGIPGGAGRVRGVSELRVLLRETLGGSAGRSEDLLEPLLDRDASDAMDAAPRLKSGYHAVSLAGPWDDRSSVTVVQDQPYPMTIQALIPVSTAPGR